MNHIFSNTLPIFLITLLGTIIKRRWLISEEFWRGLEKLSYFILFPAVLFNNIFNANYNNYSIIRLIFGLMISSCIIASLIILYRKHLSIDKIKFTSIFQGSIRYNSYIFFGLGNALFGAEGLILVSVVSAYMIIFTNVLSVIVFVNYIKEHKLTENRKNSLVISMKKMFTNPLIIASLAGFIFNYYQITISTGIKNTISSLAESALAIGMLNVGSGLKFNIDSHNMQQILVTSLTKLIILPIVTTIILTALAIEPQAKAVGLLYSCLPCASTAYILSRELGGDVDLMASIITFTTLFSVLSLSVLMYILT